MDGKREQILKLRAEGLGYRQIGKIVGISFQRVHQIYKDYKSTDKDLRYQVMDRDNFKCTKCQGDDLKLNVHHIDHNKNNNEWNNLITLCAKCHRKQHIEDRRAYNEMMAFSVPISTPWPPKKVKRTAIQIKYLKNIVLD